MFFRFKQFFWNIGSYFKKIDEKFIKNYLDEEEYKLFEKLKLPEKHHCIRVAQTALEYIHKNRLENIDIKWFIKICLLHDIGKMGANLNVIDRSMLVIMNKITKGRLKKLNHISKIDVYYNHPYKAAEILRMYNKYDDQFIFIIENHHNFNIKNNELLCILIYCDELN